MNQLPVLIRREFWEHRNLFLVLPVVIVAFNLLMYVFVAIVSTPENVNVEIQVDGDTEFIQDIMRVDSAYEYALVKLSELSPVDRERGIRMALMSFAASMYTFVWLVTFFYLLNCLYSDRRDRSILFWKSLPVSDRMTIGAKLVTAVVAVPIIYLAGTIILQLVGLISLTLVSLGTDISAWEVLWKPAFYPGFLVEMIMALVFMACWHLPLFGWLLAVSAVARSVPFVWAIGVPMAISITEGVLTNQSRLGAWMGDHAIPWRLVEDGRSITDNMSRLWLSTDMLSAILVGALLLFAAIWLRGKADEI